MSTRDTQATQPCDAFTMTALPSLQRGGGHTRYEHVTNSTTHSVLEFNVTRIVAGPGIIQLGQCLNFSSVFSCLRYNLDYTRFLKVSRVLTFADFLTAVCISQNIDHIKCKTSWQIENLGISRHNLDLCTDVLSCQKKGEIKTLTLFRHILSTSIVFYQSTKAKIKET